MSVMASVSAAIWSYFHAPASASVSRNRGSYVNSLVLRDLVAIERSRRQRSRIEMPVRRLFVQVADATIQPQRVRRVIHREIRQAALYDVTLLDTGERVSQEIVLTVRREALVQRP
jgi:hypothetical protein